MVAFRLQGLLLYGQLRLAVPPPPLWPPWPRHGCFPLAGATVVWPASTGCPTTASMASLAPSWLLSACRGYCCMASFDWLSHHRLYGLPGPVMVAFRLQGLLLYGQLRLAV